MDEFEQEIREFLTSKINSGEETQLTLDDLINIEYGWTYDDKPLIDYNISKKLSEQTLKELWLLYPII